MEWLGTAAIRKGNPTPKGAISVANEVRALVSRGRLVEGWVAGEALLGQEPGRFLPVPVVRVGPGFGLAL